jgi:hypothetical protein
VRREAAVDTGAGATGANRVEMNMAICINGCWATSDATTRRRLLDGAVHCWTRR